MSIDHTDEIKFFEAEILSKIRDYKLKIILEI